MRGASLSTIPWAVSPINKDGAAVGAASEHESSAYDTVRAVRKSASTGERSEYDTSQRSVDGESSYVAVCCGKL